MLDEDVVAHLGQNLHPRGRKPNAVLERASFFWNANVHVFLQEKPGF
jgi:hypothetical protein